MAKLSSIKIDSTAEVEGAWADYSEDIKLKIARLGNPSYRSYMRKVGKPHAVQIQQGVMDDAKLESLSKEAVAHTVLMGWANLENDDGSEMHFTPEKALEIFNDPECSSFFQFVVAFADKAENFRKEFIASAEENSQSAADGTFNGEVH